MKHIQADVSSKFDAMSCKDDCFGQSRTVVPDSPRACSSSQEKEHPAGKKSQRTCCYHELELVAPRLTE